MSYYIYNIYIGSELSLWESKFDRLLSQENTIYNYDSDSGSGLQFHSQS